MSRPHLILNSSLALHQPPKPAPQTSRKCELLSSPSSSPYPVRLLRSMDRAKASEVPVHRPICWHRAAFSQLHCYHAGKRPGKTHDASAPRETVDCPSTHLVCDRTVSQAILVVGLLLVVEVDVVGVNIPRLGCCADWCCAGSGEEESWSAVRPGEGRGGGILYRNRWEVKIP